MAKRHTVLLQYEIHRDYSHGIPCTSGIRAWKVERYFPCTPDEHGYSGLILPFRTLSWKACSTKRYSK